MNKKYLVVGQGIAGTMLSWQLLKHDVPHKVMDNKHSTSASLAAAGLINPITGRRYVKSWIVDDLLSAAYENYSELQELLQIPLIEKRRIIRTFHDQVQVNLWNESTSRPGYEEHVGQADNFSYSELVQEPLDYGVIEQGLLVHISQLITAYRDHLSSRHLYIQGHFSFENFDPQADTYTVENEAFTDIIFCEGYKVTENPFFKYLPFQPAKGESMIVEVSKPLPKEILRDNIFVIPQDEFHFWTGGGYNKDSQSLDPEPEWRKKWVAKLDALLKIDYRIKSHHVGVRPSVIDRRPLIGSHPEYDRIHLFNGMGTKGTSLSPYWSARFVDYLVEGISMAESISLERFNI